MIQGTRLSPGIIMERFDAGDSPDVLASDYGIDLDTVHEALRSKYERKAA